MSLIKLIRFIFKKFIFLFLGAKNLKFDFARDNQLNLNCKQPTLFCKWRSQLIFSIIKAQI